MVAAAGRYGLPADGGPAGGTDPGAATMRAHALALTLLERHGVVTKGAVAAERIPGGFGAVYPVLRAMEETGQCRRGYFVEGLGGAQFALPGAVDRMRALAGDLVAATAAGPEPPGAAAAGRPGHRLPGRRGQPAVAGAARAGGGLAAGGGPRRGRPGAAVRRGTAVAGPPGGGRDRAPPGRKAGAVVVLFDGDLVLYVERGGKTLLSWTEDPAALEPCAKALAGAVRDGALGRITVEKADGGVVAYDSPLPAPWAAASAHPARPPPARLTRAGAPARASRPRRCDQDARTCRRCHPSLQLVSRNLHSQRERSERPPDTAGLR